MERDGKKAQKWLFVGVVLSKTRAAAQKRSNYKNDSARKTKFRPLNIYLAKANHDKTLFGALSGEIRQSEGVKKGFLSLFAIIVDWNCTKNEIKLR